MARDRITSGLSRAVIVVEADERSGSLDTALRARRQGRLVMAVDIGSAGTSRLISEGAIPLPVEGVDFDQLRYHVVTQAPAPPERPPRSEQLSLLPL